MDALLPKHVWSYYRADALAAGRAVSRWHFWIAFVGTILFGIGLTGLQLGNPSFETILIVGSVLTLISVLTFGWTVWQAAMRT